MKDVSSMSRRGRSPLASLVCLVLGTQVACQSPAVWGQASEEERLLYGEALASLPEDPGTAEQRLEAFLVAYPDSTLCDDAAEKLATLAVGDERPDDAVRWLEFVLAEHGRGDRAEAARLALAGILVGRGERGRAADLLAQTRFDRMDARQRSATYRMLASLETHTEGRLRWLGELYSSLEDGEERKRVDEQLDPLIARLTVDAMRRLAPKQDGRVPAARLYLRLAERALDVSDVEEAEINLVRIKGFELSERDEALRREVTRRIGLRKQLSTFGVLPTFEEVSSLPGPATEGAEGAIGVVLPLTGAFARYGEESLRGILLAAGIFDPIDSVSDAVLAAVPAEGDEPGFEPQGASRGRVRVIVRDSEGNAERAAAAVRDLAQNDDVVAVVGPLLAAVADAAARVAQEHGVPLLTLTSRADVAPGRDQIFRLRTTPSDEVRFLVDYAVDELGARRFAVMYPGDSYGRGMRSHFWEAVEARGGHVVAASSYEPDATDFAEPIRRMIGYSLLTSGEREAIEVREAALKRARRLPAETASMVRRVIEGIRGPGGALLPPIVDFDALFIPDAHDKIVMIAPQLAFHDVTGVQLLGSSGWVDPDLVRVGRRHVRNAVIAALFHAESQYTFVSDFVDRYVSQFGEVPDVFAASAFDAANLVLVQLAAGQESREDVRGGIASVHGYPGASGITSFLHDGNARKRPFLLGVKGRKIIALD